MEFALEEYTGQNDQKELVWAISKKMLARDLESKRSVQTKPEIAEDFLAKLAAVKCKCLIKPENTLNMDEKGFTMGGEPGVASKVVVSAGL